MRFETFLLDHDLRGASVLDVGCGVADFWDQLLTHGIACEYVGVDISPEMIKLCRKRYPMLRFEAANLPEWEPKRTFDYTVAFGIHNIKVSENRGILESTTRRQFELSRVAAHISLLTDRYPGFGNHIQPWRAEDVLSFALEITPYVALRHDYLPNDFSVTLYREPLIDRRKDLILE